MVLHPPEVEEANAYPRLLARNHELRGREVGDGRDGLVAANPIDQPQYLTSQILREEVGRIRLGVNIEDYHVIEPNLFIDVPKKHSESAY